MQNFSEHSRKIIVSVSGAIIFLVAGLLAMFTMPSESHNPPASSQPHNERANTPTSSQTPNEQANTPASSPPPNEPPKVWYVYVTGAVRTPGVYSLSEDSRIFQVIEAAGGFSPKADQTSLNLASLLADGMHVHVLAKGERAAAPAPSLAAPSPAAPSLSSQPAPSYTTSSPVTQPLSSRASHQEPGLVDINHASVHELERLTGVGPAIAQRIYDYRQSNGPFRSAEDLLRVKGIGSVRLSKMRSQILIR